MTKQNTVLQGKSPHIEAGQDSQESQEQAKESEIPTPTDRNPTKTTS